METSIFVTDLAQQFSLSVVGPSHPVVVPLRPSWQARMFLSSVFPSLCLRILDLDLQD